ncbi:hypothetical protein [Emcibacter sp.]|uniref:hypothetical protein n=1 Tax=Emcibacter sp. TaxID=1979954 RepID=UPI003A8D375A
MAGNLLKSCISLLCTALFVTGIISPALADNTKAGTTPRVCTHHLVTIAQDGRVLRGSKENLVTAVEQGKTIRVGFGLGTGKTGGFFLTHWFEAKFLTVLGTDVFTQTPIIHRQHPLREGNDIQLPEKMQRWVATMGTNGLLYSRFLDEEKVGTHHVESWWCLPD